MLIYGFGSYFKSSSSYRDIDFLIVHDSISSESCLMAINVKKTILKEIYGASVTIISKSSEENFNFIKVSDAILLGTIDEAKAETCIDEVVRKTILFKPT